MWYFSRPVFFLKNKQFIFTSSLFLGLQFSWGLNLVFTVIYFIIDTSRLMDWDTNSLFNRFDHRFQWQPPGALTAVVAQIWVSFATLFYNFHLETKSGWVKSFHWKHDFWKTNFLFCRWFFVCKIMKISQKAVFRCKNSVIFW